MSSNDFIREDGGTGDELRGSTVGDYTPVNAKRARAVTESGDDGSRQMSKMRKIEHSSPSAFSEARSGTRQATLADNNVEDPIQHSPRNHTGDGSETNQASRQRKRGNDVREDIGEEVEDRPSKMRKLEPGQMSEGSSRKEIDDLVKLQDETEVRDEVRDESGDEVRDESGDEVRNESEDGLESQVRKLGRELLGYKAPEDLSQLLGAIRTAHQRLKKQVEELEEDGKMPSSIRDIYNVIVDVQNPITWTDMKSLHEQIEKGAELACYRLIQNYGILEDPEFTPSDELKRFLKYATASDNYSLEKAQAATRYKYNPLAAILVFAIHAWVFEDTALPPTDIFDICADLSKQTRPYISNSKYCGTVSIEERS